MAVDFNGGDIDVFAGCAGIWDGDIPSAEVSAKISPSTIISTAASTAPPN